MPSIQTSNTSEKTTERAMSSQTPRSMTEGTKRAMTRKRVPHRRVTRASRMIVERLAHTTPTKPTSFLAMGTLTWLTRPRTRSKESHNFRKINATMRDYQRSRSVLTKVIYTTKRLMMWRT